jgi:nitrile hydratase
VIALAISLKKWHLLGHRRMNSIHDMGGMDGFGAVVRETNEPVFHHDWERRMFAMASMMLGARVANIDEFRHAIERIAPADYLASSYYERWMRALEGIVAEKGVVAAPSKLARAAKVARVPARRKARAKFKAGDRVIARNINPKGHTRTPRYVRGHAGRVTRDLGEYVFPDTNAHHAGENPQRVYTVEFSARELFGSDRNLRDTIRVDLWQDYLCAAPPTASKRKRTRTRQ